MFKWLFRRGLPIALLLGLTVAGVWFAANRQVLWAAAVGPGLARFEPGSEAWELEFWIIGDGWGEGTPSLASVEVSLDGAPVDAEVRFVDQPWVRAAGGVSESDLAEVKAAMLSELDGVSPKPETLTHLEDVTSWLAILLNETTPSDLLLSGTGAVAEGQHWLDLTLDYRVGVRHVRVVDRVQVVVAAIPRLPGWAPADLHLHSTYSGGDKDIATLKSELAARGYAVGYMTDHAGSLVSQGLFEDMSGPYPSACRAVSDQSTAMFPGTEMSVGHAVSGGWTTDGHSLGYGISSTSGINDATYAPQAGLDQIDDNSPPQSSSGIAHPARGAGWVDWSVVRYYGYELMSGTYQRTFDLESAAMRRWRSECLRLASSAGEFRPGVRTGSDYHRTWRPYVTFIRLSEGARSWAESWTAVSAALKAGKTTVSLKGSLAYITLGGNDVGSWVRAPSGALPFTIAIKPVVAGTYKLTLYQDNLAAVVWKHSATLKAGQLYTWKKNVDRPGRELHYYWLYVSGADYCYTTPIYVHP
jgi:hypothetical protein